MIRPSAIASGDSYTRTGGQIICGVAPLSWAERVARSAGWELGVFAESGYPTHAITDLLPESGAYDFALTCAGTNDVLHPHAWHPVKFRADFERHLTKLSELASRVVVLGLVPNVGRLPVPLAYGAGVRDRAAEANRIIREVCAEHGATVVMPRALSRPVEFVGDCVHPTSVGHLRLAELVLDALGITPAPVTVAAPEHEALRFSRRRLVKDSLTRPPRGIAAELARHRAPEHGLEQVRPEGGTCQHRVDAVRVDQFRERPAVSDERSVGVYRADRVLSRPREQFTATHLMVPDPLRPGVARVLRADDQRRVREPGGDVVLERVPLGEVGASMFGAVVVAVGRVNEPGVVPAGGVSLGQRAASFT